MERWSLVVGGEKFFHFKWAMPQMFNWIISSSMVSACFHIRQTFFSLFLLLHLPYTYLTPFPQLFHFCSLVNIEVTEEKTAAR